MTPAGSQTARYVVLRHEGVAEPHFDFMVELGPGQPLQTWRLPAWPPSTHSADATRIDEHRNEFLTYEGPLSRDRGSVRRVESGACEVEDASDARFRLVLPVGRILTLNRDADHRIDDQSRHAWRVTLTEFSA